MTPTKPGLGRAAAFWGVLVAAIALPLYLAGQSPLLAWRDPIYIAAGFAGIVALALMLAQPLLVAGTIPGLSGLRGRLFHRWIGGGLVVAVIAHVVGLWITSPPDVIDALLFVSPTPFSAWGVIAMWAIFGAALLAAVRKRLRISPRVWRRAHAGLVAAAVVGTAVHAVQIEGTMETVSKFLLVTLVIVATGFALIRLRIFLPGGNPGGRARSHSGNVK